MSKHNMRSMYYHNITNAVQAFTFVFLALALLAHLIEEITSCPWASIAIFCVYLVYVFVNQPIHVLKFLYVYYLAATNVLGVFVIETNEIFLPELGIFSSYSGSLSTIVIYHMIFLSVIYALDTTNIKQDIVDPYNKYISIVLNILIIVILLTLIIAITHPYYSTGGDRFEYGRAGIWESVASRSVSIYLYFTPIIMMGYRQGERKKAILTIVLFILSGVLTGNKFGLFFSMIYFAIIGSIDLFYRVRKIYIYRIFGICGICISLLLCIVFIFNHITYGYSFKDNYQYLINRLSQQGQLWWRTYEMEQGSSAKIDEISDEIDSWFSNSKDPAEGTYGIYKIMKNSVSSTSLFYNKIASGSRYAFSTPATIYYYFRIPGLLLFSVLSASMYYRIIDSLRSAVADGSIIRTFLLARFVILFHSVLTQSDFDQVFSYDMIMYITIYIIYTYTYKYYHKLTGKIIENA